MHKNQARQLLRSPKIQATWESPMEMTPAELRILKTEHSVCKLTGN